MKNGMVKIMAFGDVVGKNGTEALCGRLWGLRKEYDADMVIVNGENAAVGNGLDRESAEELLRCGADVITGGNHIFRKSALYSYLDGSDCVIRPANYPSACPGNGYCIYDLFGYKVLVINLLGTVYMESLESPFTVSDRILEREKGNYDLSVIDIHAEATGEKYALARYLDGRVSAIFGTHTHVQTADEQIFAGGTGYITDLGMCGPYNSVLGIKSDIIINRFLTKLPARHEEADGETVISFCVFTVDTSNGVCVEVERGKRI